MLRKINKWNQILLLKVSCHKNITVFRQLYIYIYILGNPITDFVSDVMVVHDYTDVSI